MVGNLERLSNWAQSDTISPIRLSADPYPLWRITLTLPSDTHVEYKYVILRSQGQLVWESLSPDTPSKSPSPLSHLSNNRSFDTPPPLHVLSVNDGTLNTHRAQIPVVATPFQSLPDFRKLVPDPRRRRVASARDVQIHNRPSQSTAVCGVPIATRELKLNRLHDEPRGLTQSPTFDDSDHRAGVENKLGSQAVAPCDQSALVSNTGLMSMLTESECETSDQKWFQAVAKVSHEACPQTEQSDMLSTLESARATVEQLRASIAAMRPAVRTVANLARHSCTSSVASTTVSELASIERIATESSVEPVTPKDSSMEASSVAMASSGLVEISPNEEDDGAVHDCFVHPSPAHALNITQRSVDDALAQVASLRTALSNILSRVATTDPTTMLENNPSRIMTSTASHSSGESGDSRTPIDENQSDEEAEETFDDDDNIEPLVSPENAVIEPNDDVSRLWEDLPSSGAWAPGSLPSVLISSVVCAAIAIWLWGAPVIIFFATVLLAVAIFAALAATSDRHFSAALILDRLKNFPNGRHVHSD